MEQMVFVGSIPSFMFRVFPSGWSIEVIDNHGRVEYEMISETSIPLICCGKAIDSLLDGDGISICYSLMSG